MRTILIGRVLSGVVTAALLGSATGKMAGTAQMVDGIVRAGIPRDLLVPIAILELSCMALFLIPRTTVLGAFLLTGYFGGATLTHIIAGENIAPPLLIGLLIWAGAYFRVPELQDLFPLAKGAPAVKAVRVP